MSCNPFGAKYKSEWQSDYRRKVIVIQENKVQYKALNAGGKEFNHFKVENNLIRGNPPKCDDLLLGCDLPKQAFFIELKGSDLTKAISQIKSSIDILKSNLGGYTPHARIVLSAVVKIELMDSRTAAFKRDMRAMGGTFKKKVNVLEEEV
jgi:hypothetical protein